MERILLTIIMILGIFVGKSQSSITVELSSDSVLTGEIIEVKYILENVETKFQIPDLSDFTVVSGPSVSQSMSIINGKKSQKASYTLYIIMRQEGTFYLPGFMLETVSKTIEVPSIPVKVGEGDTNLQTLSNKIARQRQVSLSISIGENIIEAEQKQKTLRKLRKL
ncbi:MAG TPA: BatD family protein [Saprospiraceae bacterium]|nr:BatD family protein [Saprospiraceae bacterium]